MPEPGRVQLPSTFDADIREAVLALEGTVVADFRIPLPGSLKDISKASALVSGVVEDRIPALLNSVRNTTWDVDGSLRDYEFRKFDIGFPDILLVRRSNPAEVIFEIEAKSWYVLSGDALTARFLTSRQVINPGTLVMVVAWLLDGVVSGSPLLLRLHVDDALRLACARDQEWESIKPEGSHRVVEPENSQGTPRSAVKTQARGESRTASGLWRKDSDNYGKLERLHDEAIIAFRDSVLSLSGSGKRFSEWRSFISKKSALESLDD